MWMVSPTGLLEAGILVEGASVKLTTPDVLRVGGWCGSQLPERARSCSWLMDPIAAALLVSASAAQQPWAPKFPEPAGCLLSTPPPGLLLMVLR